MRERTDKIEITVIKKEQQCFPRIWLKYVDDVFAKFDIKSYV